jgi:hypothetical protein
MGRSVQFAAILFSIASTALAADPVIGNWALNVAKSKYNPGPAPRTQTRAYVSTPDGIVATVTTVNRDGTSEKVVYPSNYDGMEHHVTGSSNTDGILMKQRDLYTAESTLMHAGKVIGIALRVVSGDGKTMTITFEGTDQEGSHVKNVALYEKQ